ncbi:MAG: alginate export family protein [Acidobacteria bacterium]|nr:alginate export family protein [Acidobacteriota bacterium]
MRKTLVLAVLAVLVLASMPLAQAADSGEGKWTFNGGLRTREEHLENYADFDSNAQDMVDFMPFRARIGVDGVLSHDVTVAFQFQSFGVWGFNGDPRQSSSFPPTQQAFTTSPDSVNLYQGNVTLNHFIGKNVTLTVGRQEHMEGTGLIFGNEDFYAGTVYDGATANWKFHSWELTGLAYIANEQFFGALTPAPGGTCVSCGSEDTRVWGATGHLHFGKKMKSDLDIYAYDMYNGVQPAPGNIDKPRFWTYGAHWWRMVNNKADAKSGHLDWSAELALQSGNVEDGTTQKDLNLTGSVFEGSVGWNFVGGNAVHRVFIGGISESGDKNTGDNKIKGWTDLFSSVHGRFGGADFFGANFNAHSAGITAAKVGWMGTFKDGKHKVGVTLWNFKPTENDIQTGAGNVHVDDYGTEIDAGYKYQYTDNVYFGAGVASLKPKDGLTGGSGAPSDSVLRVAGVLDVRFH